MSYHCYYLALRDAFPISQILRCIRIAVKFVRCAESGMQLPGYVASGTGRNERKV